MKSIDQCFDVRKELNLKDLPNEIWRDIPNYEGLYQVSNLGRIKSFHFKSEKILRLCKDKDGYIYVGLSKGGIVKLLKVHRLVASAFILNPNNLPQIDHINAVKTDNRVENLRWTTAKENIRNPLNMVRFFGERNPFYGKKHSLENRVKMIANQVHRFGKDNPAARKVINLDTMCIFDTVTQAAAFYGKARKTLSGAIKEHYKCAGYYWGYFTE